MKKNIYHKEIILIIIGLLLAIFPEIVNALLRIVGVSVILYNLILYIFLTVQKKENYPIRKLIIGVILGVIIISLPTIIDFSLPVFLGVVMLVNGVQKLSQASVIKRAGGNSMLLTVFGAILLAFGIIFISNSFRVSHTLRRVLGIILIVIGISQIILDLKIRNQNKDIIDSVIDVEGYEKPNDFKRLK